MNQDIHKEVQRRGITRLCHFTPSRNLLHIAAGRNGILSTLALQEDERNVLNQTDLWRLDGMTSHICCSIEYPNGWYFDRSRTNEILFRDWVILFIRPDHIWDDDTLFSPRNAAANFGKNLSSGITGFNSMFNESVTGAYDKTRTRDRGHLLCSPTDDQAEVLIADRIPHESILSVAVRSQEQADLERVRFRVCGISEDVFSFTIAPDLFNKNTLSSAIRRGVRLPERKAD